MCVYVCAGSSDVRVLDELKACVCALMSSSSRDYVRHMFSTLLTELNSEDISRCGAALQCFVQALTLFRVRDVRSAFAFNTNKLLQCLLKLSTRCDTSESITQQLLSVINDILVKVKV